MYKRMWIIMALLWIATFTLAQGAPSQIDAALLDLSGRVGRTITLDNNTLTNWQWGQATWDDTALGCPSDGEFYAQVVTPGYIFILEYAGTIYEYHVSQDSQTVRLCEQRSTGEPTPEPPLVEQFSNSLCPAPTEETGVYARSYVQADIPAVGTLAVNRLRQAPSTDAAILAEIPNGAVFVIVAGPECDDEGIVWWQVDYDGIIGWTAESLSAERYIVPQPPNPLPQRRNIIVENAAELTLFATIEANIWPIISWSENGLLAMSGGVGANGVFVYNMNDLAQPFFIERDEFVTAIDFIPNNQQVLVGTDEGTAHIWNIVTTVDTPFVESLFVKSHQQDIRAVAFAPNGEEFASAGLEAQFNLENPREFAVTIWEIESVSMRRVLSFLQAQVTQMAYHPQGTQLSMIDEAGNFYIADFSADRPNVLLDYGASSMTYSANGQFIAVGKSDGSIALVNPQDGTTITTLTGHLSSVVGVSFSPNSNVLASVSTDGTLRLWNTQSDANIGVFELGSSDVVDMAFSPEGRLIAVGLAPNQVLLFGVPV